MPPWPASERGAGTQLLVTWQRPSLSGTPAPGPADTWQALRGARVRQHETLTATGTWCGHPHPWGPRPRPGASAGHSAPDAACGRRAGPALAPPGPVPGARGLSGSRLPCLAAARTAASPPSFPACITATSLCPSARAAASSRGAACSSAWGPQVRSRAEGAAAPLRTAAPARSPCPCAAPWTPPPPAALAGGQRRRREVAGSCPPGLHVMVIVLIPASRADGGRRRWLRCGCRWGGLGEAEAASTPSSWQTRAGWSGTCGPHGPGNAHVGMTRTECPQPTECRVSGEEGSITREDGAGGWGPGAP